MPGVKDKMLNVIIEIINKTFSPAITVTGDTAIKTDLGLDSFEIVNLICILEDRYRIEINETDIRFIVTVNDIAIILLKEQDA